MIVSVVSSKNFRSFTKLIPALFVFCFAFLKLIYLKHIIFFPKSSILPGYFLHPLLFISTILDMCDFDLNMLHKIFVCNHLFVCITKRCQVSTINFTCLQFDSCYTKKKPTFSFVLWDCPCTRVVIVGLQSLTQI